MDNTIYLDNAATSYPKPEAVYAAQDAISRGLGVNAGRGSYRASHDASVLISECRKEMAKLVESKEDNLVFTSSATIALNQIILGLSWNPYKVVYVSPYEHNAVIRPLQKVCNDYGINIKLLATMKDGSLDLEQIAIQFAKQAPNYVFMTHISNVTGYILPIASVSRLAHKYESIVIADCSQSLGLLSATLEDLEADFIVFAGHKTLMSCFGIGGWAARDPQIISPVICGGTGSDSLNTAMPDGMPGRFEPGSPNIIAIGTLYEALKWRKSIPDGLIEKHERALTNHLIDELSKNNSIHLYLMDNKDAHISIVSFNHKKYMADELGMILDQDFNIAVRTGYHCAPYIHEILDTTAKRGTVRASVSYFTSTQDIDALITALRELS